jgi:hypothetical protein
MGWTGKMLIPQECLLTKAYSGKENTRYREISVLDYRLRGNDKVNSFLEIS